MSNSYIEKLENHIRHLEKAPDFDFKSAFGDTQQPDEAPYFHEWVKLQEWGYLPEISHEAIALCGWNAAYRRMGTTKRESVAVKDIVPIIIGNTKFQSKAYAEDTAKRLLEKFKITQVEGQS